jgi:hypothetical protein
VLGVYRPTTATATTATATAITATATTTTTAAPSDHSHKSKPALPNDDAVELLCEYECSTSSSRGHFRFHFHQSPHEDVEVPHQIYSHAEFETILRKTLCLTRLSLPLTLSFVAASHNYAQAVVESIQHALEDEWYQHMSELRWVASCGAHHCVFSSDDARPLQDIIVSSLMSSSSTQNTTTTTSPHTTKLHVRTFPHTHITFAHSSFHSHSHSPLTSSFHPLHTHTHTHTY